VPTPPYLAGHIYWVENLPPLDGTKPGRHPAILYDLIDDLECLVIGITTTVCDEHIDFDQVEMPNLLDDPGATTGLSERCVALPRWFVPVFRSQLVDHAGWLPKVTMIQLFDAVMERIDDSYQV
jgi:hypothetical protein